MDEGGRRLPKDKSANRGRTAPKKQKDVFHLSCPTPAEVRQRGNIQKILRRLEKHGTSGSGPRKSDAQKVKMVTSVNLSPSTIEGEAQERQIQKILRKLENRGESNFGKQKQPISKPGGVEVCASSRSASEEKAQEKQIEKILGKLEKRGQWGRFRSNRSGLEGEGEVDSADHRKNTLRIQPVPDYITLTSQHRKKAVDYPVRLDRI